MEKTNENTLGNVALKIKGVPETRPWGCFYNLAQVFDDKGNETRVKLIMVLSGEKISLQYHRRRNEEWTLLNGSAIFVRGDEEFPHPGPVFFVPRLIKHSIVAITNTIVLETSRCVGKFSEEDIVRLSDRYGRATAC